MDPFAYFFVLFTLREIALIFFSQFIIVLALLRGEQ